MRSLNRRAFIKGIGASLGASLVLSPFLDSVATADPGRKPKRLLLFCTMGTSPDIWTPRNVSGETSFTFAPSTEPLAVVKQHLVLVDGLISGNPGNNHGAPDGLTGLGYGGGPNMNSVDQFIADHLINTGNRRPIPSLLLGADSTANGGRTMLYRAGSNLATIGSPVSAFTTLFGGALPEGTSADALLRRRRSILDNLKNEINEIESDLGSQQKAKLELHLDSIRQIETRLSDEMSGGGGGCAPPSTPAEVSNPMRANLTHLDLIVSAFACDLTRVAAIQWGSDQAMHVDLPELMLQGDEHGGMIHSGAPEFRSLTALERWLCEQFVGVINKLKAIPEPGGPGSLFDNTLIAWCRDMGDAVNHNMNSMRFVLASGDGGYLRTDPNGRYLHFNSQSPGERHERVLISLCDAMGVTDFSGFGDPNLPSSSKAPLPGLAAT